MLPLVFGRIPVKGIQHPPLSLGVIAHRQHPPKQEAKNRDLVREVKRHSRVAQRVKNPLRNSWGEASIEIGESPLERGVTGVHPDRDLPIGSQKPRQAIESALGIWGVVENPNAENEIESLVPERKLEYVCLSDIDVLAPTNVALRSFDRLTQVDSDHRPAPSRYNIRETAH